MGSTAIDQILQIAPPVRSAVEPVQPTVSDRPAFQDLLERASSETPPSKKPESVDTDRDDLTSTDQQHDTASSPEEKTLIADESAIADAEENLDSNEEAEQDSVELSDNAEILADVQASTENDAVIAPEQSHPVDTKSENPVADESEVKNHPDKTLETENENSDDGESTGKPAVLIETVKSTETQGEPTSTGLLEQENKNQQRDDKQVGEITPARSSEDQPKVASKAQIEQEGERTGEQIADVRNKTKTVDRAIQTIQAEPSASAEQTAQQPAQAEIETEDLESESPIEQKSIKRNSGQRDANPQPIASKAESPALQDEPSVLTAENRPSVAASTPPSESSSSTSPIPTNLGGEAANASLRPSGTTTAAAAETQTEAEPVPTADRARFINRVGGAIRSAQNREGEIHLQLRPPELGSLRIEIVVKQGVLTAQLETETSAARAILLDNLPALRERLAEQEIRIEKFDVDVRDEGGRQPDHPGTEDRNANRPQTEARSQHQTNSERQQAALSTALEISSTLSGGLDVRI